jgi:hypothetical protein
MLREVQAVGKDGVLFVLRPRTPAVGQLAKIVVKAAPLKDSDLDETKAYEITMSRVTVYALDRGAAPEPLEFTLAALPEQGAYSFAMVVRKNVDYRVVLALTLAGGRDLKAVFDFKTLPAEAGAESLPTAAGGHLDMTAQHDTMRVMGERWSGAWRELASDTPSWEQAARDVDAVRALQKNLAFFHLHKFQERKSEFDAMADAFGRDLSPLSDAIAQKDRTAALKRFEAVDRYSCLQCHLQFRWGVIQDPRQVPELSREK